MSTKKTTTAKAPAKTAAKAKPETKPAAKAAPAKTTAPKKPETKPAAKAPELTPFQKLFEGLPKSPSECTAEQVKALQTAYAKVKAELTEAEQGKVREYGVAATNHLKSLAKGAAQLAAGAAATDKEIQNLINEMNKVMDLEPIIVFGEDHMTRIVTEAKDLREQDFDCSRPTCFTSNATATFRKLGIVLPGDKAAAKAAKATALKAPKAPKGSGPQRVGVLSTIQELLTKKFHTKDELVAALVAKFPDRPEAGLRTTVNCQIPNRMAKEKNLTITKNDKGAFKIG